MRLGGLSSLGGTTISIFDLATAQHLFNKVGKLDSIGVAGRQNASPQELVHEIKPLLPPTAQVRTGQQEAKQASKDTSGFLSVLQNFLLAFGGVALFVGSFVIANTLSITIAQRTRELATLRTLGATRRQVFWSVMLEAFVIGLLASVDRPLPRARARQGPERALRRLRHRPPAGGHGVRDAHDRRLALRRRRRSR